MLPLALVLLAAFFLRIYGMNWDMGIHLHPDERMLIMVAEKIRFFSNLNPDFFNYGSLPIYILSAVNRIMTTIYPTTLSDYDNMLLVGRTVSVIADLLVIIVIYKIAQLLFKNRHASILSAAAYSLMFFPIQNAHFFIVDPFLNLFLLVSVYRTLEYIQKPRKRIVFCMAVALAAAAATKVTAVIFYPVLVAALIYKSRRHLKTLFLHLVIFHGALITFHFLFMPYAYIDSQRFITDVLYQTRMNNDAYVFPYTLQYVGTLPYWYYLQNIALWGVGPVLFTASFAGFVALIRDLKKHHPSGHALLHSAVLPLFFVAGYALYFLVIGRSAVKFMRYMLPLYPVFAIFAGYLVSKLLKSRYKIGAIGIAVMAVIWTSMFMNIYSKEHTRITATKWIAQNIPQGSSIAVEHWDDMLPLAGANYYKMNVLPIYEQPDDEKKWNAINETLIDSQYMIIASNRLTTPLRNLRTCNASGKACYPRAAAYYDELLAGRGIFKKISEFTVYPEIKLGNVAFTIPDQSADESFTVYDHPKIMIFKRL